MVGSVDGGADRAAEHLVRMAGGMGDHAEVAPGASPAHAVVEQTGLRIAQGLGVEDAALLFDCWKELWVGAVRAHASMLDLSVSFVDERERRLRWVIAAR